MPWARFVLYDDLHYKHVEYNLFLVVSGCPVGCGARSLPQVPSKIPFIRVAGNTINQWPVAKERLPEELSKLILELVSKRLS